MTTKNKQLAELREQRSALRDEIAILAELPPPQSVFQIVAEAFAAGWSGEPQAEFLPTAKDCLHLQP